MFLLEEKITSCLPLNSTQKLCELRREVSDCPQADQKARAIELWNNRTDNEAFRAIINHLKQMTYGCVRCCYCEDSCANAIERIWPKSLYPQRCFVWQNYAYVCSICNGKKLSKFAFIDKSSRQITTIKEEDPIRIPHLGTSYPMFLDARQENPLDFIHLDLETFLFNSIKDVDIIQQERAKYTIRELGLNSREELREARKNAYEAFIDRLHAYIKKRTEGQIDEVTLSEKYAKSIGRTPHRTVWLEMKRQHERLGGELAQLFALAPEALGW